MMKTLLTILHSLSLPLLLLAASAVVEADVIQFTGTLDPATNANLTYWDQWASSYTAPLAGPTDWERAFNIGVHVFTLASPASATFTSQGYGLGGFDSVIAVFAGAGPSAVYLRHAYGAVPGDFTMDLDLTTGQYTLAVAMFGSEPCAWGACYVTGTFADGFTNLVNFDNTRSSPLFYQVQLTTQTVPEPGAFVLLLTGIGLAFAGRSFRSVLQKDE